VSDNNLFGNYDIESAPDDPFSLKAGTYRGVIEGFEAKSGERNSDKKPYSGITVTFAGVTDSNGEECVDYDHWLSLPTAADDKKSADRKLSNIKQFLAGLEVPLSRMNTIKGSDLEGTRVIFQIKESKNGFRSLEVRLDEGQSFSNSDDVDDIVDRRGEDATIVSVPLAKDTVPDDDFPDF
jgi:hypothetical protein